MKSTTIKHKSSGTSDANVMIPDAPSTDEEDRRNYIATAAYYRAEARGFAPGRETEDWLEAEADFGVRN